ncbi:MAG TPA: GNAT family N-acetyltransferase, partial [Flavobacteriales bacterium]|nr:GNAT family N-acetyltransferase [Flavobacteriales bacterium]
DSFHLGAWADDALVGIASIYAEACAALPAAKPYRLRGMAVHPDRRGLGVGALLVVEALNAVRTADGDLLWCNARTSASGFYTRLGFAVVGEAFELPGIGPHHLMHRAP